MLTQAEIRLAAESIAAQVWEKGGSLDQLQIEIARAFRRDSPKAQETAQAYAWRWWECEAGAAEIARAEAACENR